MAIFRILSLDGGGIRGLLSIAILERLEDEIPGWLDQVDLIAGTSTGGIIALGIANGISLAELHRLYYEKGKRIFDDSWLDDLLDVGKLVGAEYSNRKLKHDIKSTLGDDVRLRDLKKKVLISTFDLDSTDESRTPKRIWKPKFFHNFPEQNGDGDMKVVDVAMYTSAAPTYFPSVDGYIDGGVCANNPSMAALAQTQDKRIKIANRPTVDEIMLLSVGTGIVPQFIKGKNLDWGYAQWAKPLIQIMMDGVSGVADYQCRQILQDQYCRVSPVISPKEPIGLGEWRKRDELVRIAKDYDLTDCRAWLNKHWIV